jgi:hypothetical protein
MIETTFDIWHVDADTNCEVASNVGGELAEQADLVSFAHYVARVFLLLGPARAGTLVDTLILPGDVSRPAVAAPSKTEAIVRFVDGASGPRLYFRLNVRGKLYANLSVDALRRVLREEHGDDLVFCERLARVAELMGRLGATGQVRAENELDVALAAADVAWRFAVDADAPVSQLDLECPSCRYSGDRFEPRLWPSEGAVLRRCGRCGAGVWKRGHHRARSIRADIWAAMESMRAQLAGAASDEVHVGASETLLEELKRVFVENGWPYSEVTGAPVIVSELSGPEGSWDFYAQAVEEKDLVLLYSIAPQRVPEEHRLAVSEFLTRANYGLADGNFELDYDDGEVRFKSVLHAPAHELDRLMVKRVVRLNGTALETYLPAIASVIAGEVAVNTQDVS